MAIKCVIDSSTLISLAKIGELDLLVDLGVVAFCPESVYEETVEMALLHGHYDALEIKKLADNNFITFKKINSTKLKGLAKTDAEVVTLGIAINAIVLANDTKLARMAIDHGLLAFGSSDLLFLARQKHIITNDRFIAKITELVEKNRLSSKSAEQYLR